MSLCVIVRIGTLSDSDEVLLDDGLAGCGAVVDDVVGAGGQFGGSEGVVMEEEWVEEVVQVVDYCIVIQDVLPMGKTWYSWEGKCY